MIPISRYWADWTTREFALCRAQGLLANAIAVLPLGAIEQHGPHLPLHVDRTLVDGIVAAALAHIPTEVLALFLPTQAVGLSPEHAAFVGTLTLSATTTIALWTDIAESVAACGIKKLVLFNAHGGNVGAMDIVARDLRQRLGLLVYRVNWFDLPLTAAGGSDVATQFSAHEHRFGIHAGAIETALMLALTPTQVRLEQVQNFASTAEQRAQAYDILGNGRSAKLGWQMQDYNPQGAVGNAAAASAAQGQAVLAAAAQALARLLVQLHQLPLSTLQAKPVDWT